MTVHHHAMRLHGRDVASGDCMQPDWPEKLPLYAAPSGTLLIPEDIAEASLC